MARPGFQKRYPLTLIIAAVLAASPVMADKPSWAGGGKEDNREQQERHDYRTENKKDYELKDDRDAHYKDDHRGGDYGNRNYEDRQYHDRDRILQRGQLFHRPPSDGHSRLLSLSIP